MPALCRSLMKVRSIWATMPNTVSTILPSATHSVGPTGTLGGQSGTGASATYYVHGNVAASQGGTATAGTANNTRTLTITY